MSEPPALYAFDAEMARGSAQGVVGVDEVGRGPLAGPVVAAAVKLEAGPPIERLNDSKKLTPARRDRIYEQVITRAQWAVGMASPAEIDRINILQASLLAMQRAMEKLAVPGALALIDGNRTVSALDKEYEQVAVVGGDARSAAIAAASVVAKVTRDRMMVAYAEQYPQYRFDKHKGYPTALHIERLRACGPSAIHRRSFCHKFVAQTQLSL